MKSSKAIIVLLAGLSFAIFASVAKAAEIVVTPAKKGSALSFSLDLVSSGDVSVFDFHVVVPGSSGAKADLSGCISELPSNFTGGCNFIEGKVVVVVYGHDATPLPAGIVPIGSVSLIMPGTAARGELLAKEPASIDPRHASRSSGQLRIENLTVGNAAGKALDAKASVLD
jgi:hypothetical protein